MLPPINKDDCKEIIERELQEAAEEAKARLVGEDFAEVMEGMDAEEQALCNRRRRQRQNHRRK